MKPIKFGYVGSARERSGDDQSRAARRKDKRKMRKVVAKGASHDPRAVKFHF